MLLKRAIHLKYYEGFGTFVKIFKSFDKFYEFRNNLYVGKYIQ